MIPYFTLSLIFPLIVITGFTCFLIYARRHNMLIKPFRSPLLLLGFLVIWTLLGFFTQHDFTEQCGCLYRSRGIFSLDYIIFSAISLILLLLGILVKTGRFRASIVCMELAYWLFKLFVLKSGYEGGLGILVFKYYDFIGLLIRLLLLNSLFGNRVKEYLLCLIAGLVIIIKMLWIPCNTNFIYSNYIHPYYNRLIVEKINGDWTGVMVYPKDTTVYRPIDKTNTVDLFTLNDTVNYRRATIVKRIENVSFSFNYSVLNINNTLPELDGNYCLYHSQPELKYFVYVPCKYSDTTNIWQHSIKISLENQTDSTLFLKIENGIDITLDLQKKETEGFKTGLIKHL